MLPSQLTPTKLAASKSLLKSAAHVPTLSAAVVATELAEVESEDVVVAALTIDPPARAVVASRRMLVVAQATLLVEVEVEGQEET
jgi:hypothetical protein